MAIRYTFRQLEYFVAVGEAGTIALAALRVNVSSPSISAAISQLEDEFGVQLFVRHHAQGLSLTPGGQRVFNEAKRILGDATALIDLANEISESARGPISVGVLSTIAPMVSASIRRSFEAAYPGASVSLREGNQVDLLRMLGQAEIDVAITYNMEIPKDIAFEELIGLRPHVMISNKHSLSSKPQLSLKDLEGEPFVLLDLPLSREYFLSVFKASNASPNVAERTTQMSVAHSLVANGFGFGMTNIQTAVSQAPDGEPLNVIPLSDAVEPLMLGLATKQSDHRSRIVLAFYEHMKEQIEAGAVPGLPKID